MSMGELTVETRLGREWAWNRESQRVYGAEISFEPSKKWQATARPDTNRNGNDENEDITAWTRHLLTASTFFYKAWFFRNHVHFLSRTSIYSPSLYLHSSFRSIHAGHSRSPPRPQAETFAATRRLLENRHLPAKVITDAIRQTWLAIGQSRHDAWEQARLQGRRLRDDEKPVKAWAFPRGVPIPSTDVPRPYDYARQKLVKGEWVELWYFTREGCFEAAKPTSTTTTSPNVLPDTALTCDQISFAGKILARIMKEERWPNTHIDAIVDFFCRLDNERINMGYDGGLALIEYQATVRKAWFDTLGTDRAFDLAEFNIQRLQAIQTPLSMSLHRRALVSPPNTLVMTNKSS